MKLFINIRLIVYRVQMWKKCWQIFAKNGKKNYALPPKHVTTSKLNSSQDEDDNSFDDFEKRARILFQKGIDLEKAGKLYEAIQFYRKAVQIVPDIEFKLENTTKPRRDRQITESSEDGLDEDDDNSSNSNSDNEEINDGELLARIQRKINKIPLLCLPKFEQKTTHISVLPLEIILLILRWLVSSDLDLRSLEMFSAVCRGFYLCARDAEIWRLACIR